MTEDRVYGGQPVGDRRRERRERFLAAALELFSTAGYAATSVPQVCRAAGLSTRQFYQEYTDREALLRSLYDRQQDHSMREVSDAVLQRIANGCDIDAILDGGVRAFVAAYQDARLTRISFVEVVGVSPEFERYRHARRRQWGELLDSALRSATNLGLAAGSTTDLQWAAYIGAVNSVIVERAHDPTITDEDIVLAMRTLLRPGILG